jgi:hypothetical protein
VDYNLDTLSHLVAILTTGAVSLNQAALPELASLFHTLRLSLRIVQQKDQDTFTIEDSDGLVGQEEFLFAFKSEKVEEVTRSDVAQRNILEICTGKQVPVCVSVC